MLSILTLLVITAATLTYTAGLEVRAAGNFGNAIQSRMAAMAGLPAGVAAILDRQSLAVAYTQRWANTAEVSSRQSAQSAAARAGAREEARGEAGGARFEWTHASQALTQIDDEGGKLALNCLSADLRSRDSDAPPPTRFDRQDLQDLLARVIENRGLSEVNAESLAQAVVARRFGEDGQVGGTLDSETSQRALNLAPEGVLASDPRFPAGGDDQLFVSMDQVLGLDGMPTDSEAAQQSFQALSAVLTPYSQCRLVYEVDGQTYDCLDPNAASPEEIYEALRRVYPDLSSNQLKQFAVNVADWRDEDHVPTVYPDDTSRTPILGVERTPYLSEVWPDSSSTASDGDDGQYFEIYNPYDESIDLTGWTVKIGLAGELVRLQGRIEGHGFVVVTDDLDESLDPDPEDDEAGYGSLYDIFGVVNGGGSRRVLVDSAMNLPDSASTLFLRDAKGNLIDWFTYSGLQTGGIERSAQRGDPRLRTWSLERCSPLAKSPSDTTNESEFAENSLQDNPFPSPACLFNVYAGSASVAQDAGEPVSMLPQLRDSAVGLDARLLDVFALHEPEDAGLESIETQDKSVTPTPTPTPTPRSAESSSGAQTLESLDKVAQSPAAIAAGRINLNTAPLPVLQSLPGMTDELAERILSWRASFVQANGSNVSRASQPEGNAPFESIGDFLENADIWDGVSPHDELEIVRHFINLVTVNSMVFSVRSQNRTQADSSQHRQSVAQIRSLVLVDGQGRFSALNWRYIHETAPWRSDEARGQSGSAEDGELSAAGRTASLPEFSGTAGRE